MTFYKSHRVFFQDNLLYTECMARRYWFKTHKAGIVRYPSTWEGWLVIIAYLAGLVYFFLQADSISHFLTPFLIFSALLISVSYLKSEL